MPTLEVSSPEHTSSADTSATALPEDEEVKELLKHKPPLSPYHAQQQRAGSPAANTGTSSSPTPSTESESSSLAEGTTVQRPSPPPCSLRERVSTNTPFSTHH